MVTSEGRAESHARAGATLVLSGAGGLGSAAAAPASVPAVAPLSSAAHSAPLPEMGGASLGHPLADELLGLQKLPKNGRHPSRKVLRRLQKIEELPAHDQAALLKTIDTFLKGAER
jgi:hypothetical protein